MVGIHGYGVSRIGFMHIDHCPILVLGMDLPDLVGGVVEDGGDFGGKIKNLIIKRGGERYACRRWNWTSWAWPYDR